MVRKVLFLMLGLVLISSGLAFAQCEEGRLRAEAPRRVIAGQPFNIHVTGFLPNNNCNSNTYHYILGGGVLKEGDIQAPVYQGCCSSRVDFLIPNVVMGDPRTSIRSVDNYVELRITCQGSRVPIASSRYGELIITVEPASVVAIKAEIGQIATVPTPPVVRQNCQVTVKARLSNNSAVNTVRAKAELRSLDQGQALESGVLELRKGRDTTFTFANVRFNNPQNNIGVTIINTQDNKSIGSMKTTIAANAPRRR